jgi:hypothetical protein
MKTSTIFLSSRLSILIAAGVVLGSSTVARAQKQPAIDESFARAALIVKAFDQLSTQCAAGRNFNARESALIAAWEKVQNINAIRTQTRELSADMQRQLDKAASLLFTAVNQKQPNAEPCSLAVSLTKLSSPGVATIGSPSTSDTKPQQATNPGARTANGSRNPTAMSSTSDANVSKLVATIDSFGFDMRTVMGIGGFLTQDIYPVVLFRNGEALTDVKGLTYSGGLDAYRRAHPEDWTQWQRSGGRVQLKTSKGWKALPFPTTYQSLPSQFRLNGTYRSLSGTGNVAVGGSASVAAWRAYTFSSDGRIMRGNGAGSSASSGGSSVVTSSVAPNQRGRYEIDGLVLRINYDDGSTENRIIITDPKDPKSVIWLDGTSYVRRGK